MSKMIIYFCLFIPLLFLSADSSSIRGRNHKNDLVPFLSSRLDAMKRDPNSLKVVSKDPFIIQLHMPNSKEMEARATKEKDKKRKRPMKKRVSKIKPLRKKHRKRRDLLTVKTRPREEKPFRFQILRAANYTERLLKNNTRNSVNRMEILKALSSDPQKTETKRNKLERIRNFKDEEKINTGKTKKNNLSNRNLPKHQPSLSDRSKLAYPSTPKLDRRPQKYTYKDLIADRERLEQKIKYIKNMLNSNITNTDDGVRVRRRSDSDRTANKIAKMFLTLSAVNGLHDKKKSKCNDDDDDDDDRVDVWQKERRNNPLRKSTSSNEERYKVKKWIEFMKNKRSSGKTCPCMGNAYGDEGEAFPLEQKLPKGYFLLEKGRSSEESSESYTNSYYHPRDKINRNDNVRNRLSKSLDQDNKNKALSVNGKRKSEVPFEDLEVYRSRARQILRNAEEILDKIKEEEEKRLAMPNILMSQLKELTARIHGDPRNNENDLIKKIQKNLGWGPLTTPQEETDGTFLDNVKSFILDPYEKAKALTDESTKKLSSYLLRNLGKLQESSQDEEMTNAADKTNDQTLKIYLGKEPRVYDLSKNKEDLQNWEHTLSAISGRGDDAINKESNWDVDREELYFQKVEDMVEKAQKEINDFKNENSIENSAGENKESSIIPELGKEIVAESKPESKEPEIILEKTAKNSDIIKNEPFRETEGIFQGKEGESNVQASRDMQEEEGKVPAAIKEKEKNDNEQDNIQFQSKDDEGTKNVEEPETMLEKTLKNSDIIKNEPFRETEGIFQGKEGESNVQASRNMQEEKEFEKIVKIPNDRKNEESSKADLEIQNSNAEEKAANEDVVARALEKQEKNEEVTGTASQELEKADLEEETPIYSASDERVGEKSDESFLSITLIDKPSSTDSESDTPVESEQKENVKADLAEKYKSNEEPVLEKQRALDREKSEEEMKAEEDRTENFKESANIQAEKELPPVLKENSSSEEIIQKEIGAKTHPEYADLVKETKHISGMNSDEEGDLEDERRMGSEEILESNNEETISRENAGGETLKAMSDNKENIKKEKLEKVSREDSTEDLNTSLKAILDQETSNQNLDESTSQESDSDDLLKETKSNEQENESLKESVRDKNLEKSQEILAKEKNDETLLSIEKPNDERQSSIEDTDLKSFLKETNPDEAFENVKGGETPLKATMIHEDQDTVVTQENKNSEVTDVDFDKDNNKMNLKASLDKDEDLEKDDEVNLKASLDKDEDLEKDDGVNLKASLDKDEDLEKDDGVNLKATLDEDEDLEKDDGVNLKATLDENEDLEKDDGVNLKASLDKDEDLEKDDEVNLKATLDEDEDLEKDDGVNLKATLDEDEGLEKDDEVNLKASSDEDEDLEKEDGITLKASNRYGYDDIQNLSEEKDVVSQNESQEKDNQRGSTENVKNVLNTQKDDKFTDVVSQVENQKNDSGERGLETLEKTKNIQETLVKEDKEATPRNKNQNMENIDENDETFLKTEKLDENIKIKDVETNQESGSNEEMEDSKKGSEVLKETNLNEDIQDEKIKILEEILKEIPDNQKQESVEVDNDEMDSDKSRENEYLEAVSKNDAQENLEERPDEETQGSQETNLEATLEGQDKGTVLKEGNVEASEEKQENLEESEKVRAVFDNQEQFDEVMQNFDEDKREKDEDMDVEKILQKAKNFEEELNSSDETLKAVLSEQNEENLEENYETFQEENPEEVKDETPLRSASLEDEFDNKIDYDTAESAEETDDIQSMKNANVNESEETLREFPQDFNNQIGEKSEEEAVLKSAHFDSKVPDGNGYNYEPVMEDNVEAKYPLSNREDDNSQQNFQQSGQLELQKPDSTSKSLKASKLKVPKWIGKIMKDLNGKEKTDITSMQNLNPDKIDDMLGKIGKAEQQNRLESDEVDCKKECACAEEMNTRSRNIGRYEIVKDFLHWVKDLQLNRVLNDE